MRIAYPVRIDRDMDNPAEAIAHFPDFGDDADARITWQDDVEAMLRSCAIHLGTAYYTATCFGDEAPAPSAVKTQKTRRRVCGEVTCNYDLFCKHCLTVTDFAL